MGIDLASKLVETATRISTTKNEYGDVVYGSTGTVACLYRDISMLDHIANRNEVSIDGLLWFAPTEDVQRGDIYYHASEGYLKIMRIVKAKRLVADNTHQFTKCEVNKQRQLS